MGMAALEEQGGCRTGTDGLLMNSELLLHAWREMLPPEICISAGPIVLNPSALTEQERASAGPVDQDRLLELQNGRMYAKQALTTIGCPAADIPVAADRSPVWPCGVVGSITHTSWPGGGHVAVAVGLIAHFDAIGIDVEREAVLWPTVWEYILTPREQEQIGILSPEARSAQVQTIWCVKEAIRKAGLRSIEPTSIEVEHELPSDQHDQLSWSGRARYINGSPKTWHGRTIRSQGLILTAVAVLNHADSNKCF